MSRRIPYHSLLLLMMLAGLVSCREKKNTGDTDWTVTLRSDSRKPYGASIAWETLPQYFPNAKLTQLNKLARYDKIGANREAYNNGADSPTLVVMLGLDYYISDEEWEGLLRFAGAGNELFILSSNLDEHLSRSLHLNKESGYGEEVPLSQYNDGTDAQRALKLLPDSSNAFGYTGRNLTSWYKFNKSFTADTFGKEGIDAFERRRLAKYIHIKPDTLGMAKSHPDFLRYRVGRGHITLHAAPLVLSNYFLLQAGNRAYLDAIWHSFPSKVAAVWWNEYYKRSVEKSDLSVLLKYPAMRWAIIISLCTLLVYVLFGIKRLQRVVPVILPVENASVSFVETVGALYFNKGNHANLAEKMVQHFLEFVRTKYYLDTSLLNPEFTKLLAAKSGKSEAEVQQLLLRIHDLRLAAVPVTPEYLYDFYRTLHSYYKA